MSRPADLPRRRSAPSSTIMGLSIVAGTSLGSALGLVMLLLAVRFTTPSAETAGSPPPSTFRPGPASASAEPVPTADAEQPAASAAASTPDTLLEGLATVLEEETASVDATVAVHVRLQDGRHGGLNAGEPAAAAGLARLPLAAAVLAAWEGGFLTRTAADGERLRRTIASGDLKAADELLDRLGRSQATEWLNNHGFPGSRFGRSFAEPPQRGEIVTTPADISRLLMGVARQELVSPAASRELGRLMEDGSRRLVMASVAPAGSRSLGLRGADGQVFNEGAVVQRADQGPVAICIMVSDGEGPGERAALVARIYRRIQDWLRANVGYQARREPAAASVARAF